MGNALKIAATEDSLVDHMKKGGPVMVPIVGLGLAAVMIALLKWLQLSRIRLATPADLKLILAHLNAGHPGKVLACRQLQRAGWGSLALCTRASQGKQGFSRRTHVGENVECQACP